MTRIDTLIVAIFAAAATLLAAAGFLVFLVDRGLPLEMTTSFVVAGLIAVLLPALTATGSSRLSKWRGIGAWLVLYTIAAVVIAAVFGLLGL